jgi:hypothetical protein
METKLTVYFDGRFWIGVFERNSPADGYSAARTVFGAEPSDAELLQFIRFRMHTLSFSEPSCEDDQAETRRINPKRIQKLIRKELESQGTSTKSQEAIRLRTEARKVERAHNAKTRKEEDAERKFILKQEKRKEKHRGH